MLRKNKYTIIITSLITVLPVLIGLLLWNRLPDIMATHFGFNNQADGFSSKAFAVFGLPLILLAVHLFCAVVTSYDPRRQNISRKMFTLVLWVVPFISLFMSSLLFAYNLGYSPDLSSWLGIMEGLLFLVIGNFLPKARQNYTIGIKIPWTLANEENWNRTHRLAGYFWMACGALLIILNSAGMAGPFTMMILLLVMITVPFVYSFILHAYKGL